MLKRIGDVPVPCVHPEHLPPNMMVLAPGVYQHICPGCGRSSTFTVPMITC